MADKIKQRWQGMASVTAVCILGLVATVMVIQGYQCRTLYPFIVGIAGLGGFTIRFMQENKGE